MNFAVDMSDKEARRIIAEELDATMLVEASAGTGKTFELVRRLVALLGTGRLKVDGLVALTFTRKAAGELKLRLRQAIDQGRWATRTSPAWKKNLEVALGQLEAARISTIHAFLAEVLRERPVEAAVDPKFVELDERQSRALFSQVFRRWMEQRLFNKPIALQRALSRLPSGAWDRRTPFERLEQAAWSLAGWRDLREPWEQRPFARDEALQSMVARCVHFSQMTSTSSHPRDPLFLATAPVRNFTEWHSQQGALLDDLVEGRIVALHGELSKDKRRGTGPYSPQLDRSAVLSERAALIEGLSTYATQANAQLAAQLKEELSEAIDEYQKEKRTLGKLDFSDLLLDARALVRDNIDVRAYLQQKFSHILVDEFQDTDPIQTEVLFLLASNTPEESEWRNTKPMPGKLFLVGDPKQSIYRFRRADLALYEDVKDVLLQAGAHLVYLQQSHRANTSIQAAINTAFAPEIRGNRQKGMPLYVPLSGGDEAPSTQPSLVALPVSRPFGRTRVTKAAVDASLPHDVAAFVDWLVRKSGWKVREPTHPEHWVPVEPRHICILFRRYSAFGRDVTAPYLRALEARELPHLLLGSRSFREREEIECLLAAFRAIEWPGDELSVFACLRGRLFSIHDDVLFCFRERHQVLHPFRPKPAEEEPSFVSVWEALALLRKLHTERNRRPIVDTVQALLATVRAYTNFALWPAGEQVLANVQRVQDLARSFEAGGGLSFRGFVQTLAHELEHERTPESPIVEAGSQGVRVMTVHAAKGLEFPVVILGDINAPLAVGAADRTIDWEQRKCAMRLLGCRPWELLENEENEKEQDRQEGLRVSYVAATRARDLLVVPGLGLGIDTLFPGGPDRRSWFGPLDKVIYPPVEDWRRPSPAPGCPAFQACSVLESADMGPDQKDRSVHPGQHVGLAAGPPVVWWDPAALNLSVRPYFGLKREKFLAEDSTKVQVRAGRSQYQRWRERKALALELGERHSIFPFQPSETEESPPEDFVFRFEEEVLAVDEGRPHGARFGSLVHAVFRDVPLQHTRGLVVDLCSHHGRILGATQTEITAAESTLKRLLGHELIKRAFSSKLCHRELPLVVEVEEGQLLDGVLDLVFFEDESWVVVDIKTDKELAAHRARYRRQLAWYMYGLSRLKKAYVKGVLLRV